MSTSSDSGCDAVPQRLVAAFEAIARTRMADFPLLNPALGIEAVGFERDQGPGKEEAGWFGVLVTPWCMNLVWCPDDAAHAAAPGATRTHDFGSDGYTFIGAFEPALGAYEACSLFSPMHDFADAAAARAVATAALQALRQSREATRLEAPARRAFLTGRPGTGASPAARS